MKMHHKLISYSTSAIAFILLHAAKAQAVYTDIDPDIVLDEDFDALGIDMDNNGDFDFAFIKFSYTTSDSIQDYQKIEKMFCGPYGNSANMIAGTHPWRFYPYALSSGEVINDELLFYNYGYQRMAYQLFSSFEGFSTVILMDYGGKWYPEMFNHYLGVKFEGEDDCIHYGWIRCSIEDSGKVLTIKDYAFETKCDVGILAGDIIGDTSVSVENINSLDATIYSFENTIHVELKDLNAKTEIYIYSISGDLIYTKTLSDVNTTISLPLTKGIYIVNIVSLNGSIAKEIFMY